MSPTRRQFARSSISLITRNDTRKRIMLTRIFISVLVINMLIHFMRFWSTIKLVLCSRIFKKNTLGFKTVVNQRRVGGSPTHNRGEIARTPLRFPENKVPGGEAGISSGGASPLISRMQCAVSLYFANCCRCRNRDRTQSRRDGTRTRKNVVNKLFFMKHAG